MCRWRDSIRRPGRGGRREPGPGLHAWAADGRRFDVWRRPVSRCGRWTVQKPCLPVGIETPPFPPAAPARFSTPFTLRKRPFGTSKGAALIVANPWNCRTSDRVPRLSADRTRAAGDAHQATLLHWSRGLMPRVGLVWGRALDRKGDRWHHIPQQRHRMTNWAKYDAGPQARGSPASTILHALCSTRSE
jgi:hypothetical protein